MALTETVHDNGVVELLVENPPVNAFSIADLTRLTELLRGYEAREEVRCRVAVAGQRVLRRRRSERGTGPARLRGDPRSGPRFARRQRGDRRMRGAGDRLRAWLLHRCRRAAGRDL